MTMPVRVARVQVAVPQLNDDVEECRTELDSHADTCVLGKNAPITHGCERPVEVTGCDKSHGTKTCKTASGVVGVFVDGNLQLLHVHQAAHMPNLDNNLLCPMQLRLNGARVSDLPKFLSPDPTDGAHSVGVPLDDGEEELTMHLSLNGVSSGFESIKPTVQQFESAEEGVDLHSLTDQDVEWDPSTESFSRREEAVFDCRGQVCEREERRPCRICGVSMEDPSDDDLLMALCLNRQVMEVSSEALAANRGLHDDGHVFNLSIAELSTAEAPKLDPAALAERWGISIEQAKRTVEQTAQRGFRSVLHPALSRRFRSNDRQLRCRRLPVTMFADALVSGIKSRRGNLCAQVFVHPSGWKRAHPVEKKSNSHDGPSLLHQREGAPAELVMDGSKEQTMGEFSKKAGQAGTRVRQTEPHSSNSNSSEGGIGELKTGFGRKMHKSQAPKVLWDDCLELEAFLQSNAWNSRMIDGGEVPETVISGETSDTSAFAQHEWCEWVMFRDTSVATDANKWVLGKHLGPSLDVGPALCAKMLKANGAVVHRSACRSLTPEEWASEEHAKLRADFLVSVNAELGAGFTKQDLVDEDFETPT